MNIYIASNNEGKIKQIASCFPTSNIFSINDIEKFLNVKINIKENGETFEENSIIKVKYLSKLLTNLLRKDDIIIADDSGITIPSLPNILGVYTKRQMKEWCDNKNSNITEIDFYNHISQITPKPKTCIFEIVIAIIKNNECKTYSSKLKGTLANECRGKNGFGFDPIFEYNNKTLAEMTDKEKEKINIRAQTIHKLLKDFKK